MSKRKGLSLEEKRTKMLEIFHESKDFYQLKELEKLGPKQKGIVAQSVKDIVQSLVHDGLVDSDKIGTSVYFWSYPSKALNTKKRELNEIIERIEEVEKKLKVVKEKVKEQKERKQESEERATLLNDISVLEVKEKKLREQIQEFKDNDPTVVEEMKENTKCMVLAVNRWTDNIFAIKSWCKKNFMVEEAVLDKQFEIPSDMDYFDVP